MSYERDEAFNMINKAPIKMTVPQCDLTGFEIMCYVCMTTQCVVIFSASEVNSYANLNTLLLSDSQISNVNCDCHNGPAVKKGQQTEQP